VVLMVLCGGVWVVLLSPRTRGRWGLCSAGRQLGELAHGRVLGQCHAAGVN
jgi:hypothetical protein